MFGMRVALLNCYLQGGHTENAEVESSARFVEAARRLGIEARCFARSEDLAAFRPDFVLSLSYNDAKLAGFPTYILLTAPPRWFDALPRFRRNVLTYDGYWTVSPSVSRQVGALYAKAGKPDLGAFAAISYVRTDFAPLDFSLAFAAYIGTNWDGNRHADLFRALAPLGVARFFGKRERWAHMPEEALGGEVPFDGRAVLETYRAAGIGLCLGHADFDAEGIPTSRTFEVPAASAVMIAARNALVEEAFGDAVLYIDPGGAPETAAGAIREHVAWVRGHPKQALAMAEACHRVFNERFALEALLANALDMHRRACREVGFTPRDAAGAAEDAGGFGATVAIAVRDATHGGFARCLDSVLRQTLPARRVIVLDGTTGGEARDVLRAHTGAREVEHRRVGHGPAGFATQLARAWDRVAGEWVCCITPDEALYPNHLFAAAEAAKRHRARSGGAPPAIVHSGLVQCSEAGELAELMHDYYNVLRAEHMRLPQFDFSPAWKSGSRLPLNPASLVLHAPSLAATLAGRRFPRLLPPALARRLRALAEAGGIAFTASVTLATMSPRRYSGYGEFTPPAD
jgi:hypothetical protein